MAKINEDPVWLEDSETELELRAAILIAAASGIMEHLKQFEPATHTRRYRTLDKVSEKIVELFDLYPLTWEYDLVDLGMQFFDKEHDQRLRDIIKQGLLVLPPAAPNGLKKLVAAERWKRGDVLYLSGITIVIHSVHPEEYHFVRGPALLYSSTNYPVNPLLHKWKRIAQLGENCTDEEIRESMWVKGAKPY